MEFETQLELKNFIAGFAKRTGCRIIIKFETFANASRSVELFVHEGAWARGDGYCNFKTKSQKADRYVIKGDIFCLPHNHLVEIPISYDSNCERPRGFDARTVVVHTEPGEVFLPFPMVTHMLTDQFPDCRIQKPLLHRLLPKGKLQAFGGDRDAMNSLVKLGRSYEEHGDGGAKMNAYGFVFLPAIVIDCLGAFAML
ncbi:Uncharacterized protein PBTT_07429 [Plasmodiophora brassicae]